MRVIRIAVVCIVLIGIVVATFLLMMGGLSDSDATHDAVTPETGGMAITDEHVTGLDQVEDSVIAEYVAMFSDGWNDMAYHNAKSYIDQPQREADREQLADALSSGIMIRLDSVITNIFRSDPPQQSIASHRVLGPAYAGLELLASEFPVVTGRSSYLRLMDDRRLFDGIFSFGTRSFVLSPKYDLRIVHVGGAYSLDWNETLHDYAQYRRQQDAVRTDLKNRLARCEDLRNISWMGSVLDQQRFNEKILTAESTYKNNERAELIRRLRSLHMDSRIRSNADARRSIANQLNAVESNLPSFIYTTEVSSAFEYARNQLLSTSPITQ